MKVFFKNHLRRFMFITLVILLIAEVFIFNYKSFLLHPGNSSKYINLDFPISESNMTGLYSVDGLNLYEVTEDNPSVSFSMCTPVKTFCLDAYNFTTPGEELTANIAYSTESQSSLATSRKNFSIVQNVPNSKYVTCNYAGNVLNIKITLNAEVGEQLCLKNFAINEKIPMHFSFMRIIFLFLLSCLIYTLLKYPAFQESFNMKKRSHGYAVVFTIMAFLIFIVFIYHMYVGDYSWYGLTYGNQMTMELVDSFEHGQVHLLDEVPDELLNLSNPYDWDERIAGGFAYKWDHLLFEGKYYSYYGIAPVLTLFLPYHMITGYYFSSSLACFLYTLLSSLFIGLSFLTIIKNWFNKTPLKMVIMGLITTMFSSCILLCVQGTNFYEIAQSSALCFLSIGFYFMLNSGIFTKNKIQLKYLTASSIFISLAVLSRATTVLYAIAMVGWIVYGYFQYIEHKSKKKASVIKYFIAAMLPYVIFGIIQMIYNYLRFKNPFDFGIQYSLTINDFTRTEMQLGLVMISIVNFLFAVPIINSTFPFIHGNFDPLNVNGYYFVATKPTIGILPSILPTLSLLYAPKLAKHFTFKEKIKLLFAWLLPGVIIPIILIAVTWESGYAIRYGADFSWQLCIAAFAVIFFTYNRLNNETVKKWLARILFVSTAWCVLCFLAITFTYSPADAVHHNINGAQIFYKMRDLIVFWS